MCCALYNKMWQSHAKPDCNTDVGSYSFRHQTRPHFHREKKRKDLAICCRRITTWVLLEQQPKGVTTHNRQLSLNRLNSQHFTTEKLFVICGSYVVVFCFFFFFPFLEQGKCKLLRTDIQSYINQPVSKRFRTYITNIFNRNYSFYTF